jgi:hypothetical protein
MVYNTQKYWVFGLFPSSGILENTTFRKLDLFPSSGEGGGEDTYPPEDGNRSSFRNVVFSRIPDDGKSPKTQYFCEQLGCFKFEVNTAIKIHIVVFSVMRPRGLAGGYKCFRGANDSIFGMGNKRNLWDLYNLLN